MNSAAARLAYRPAGLVLGLVAGAVSAAAFRQVWKRIGGTEVPDARDPSQDWVEVILAAALNGAIYAGVRAAFDRAGARLFAHAAESRPTRSFASRDLKRMHVA